jgi:hypothetical protein
MTGTFEVRVRAFRARHSSSRMKRLSSSSTLRQAVRFSSEGEYVMPKKKLSDRALAALIKDLIAKEPHEFDGYLWAARPQSYYFETLGRLTMDTHRADQEATFRRADHKD